MGLRPASTLALASDRPLAPTGWPQAPFLGQWLGSEAGQGVARGCGPAHHRSRWPRISGPWLSSPTRWAAGRRQQPPSARRLWACNCWRTVHELGAGSGCCAPGIAHPKTFAAVEGSAVLGAAAGAGIAETLDPGDELTRFGGELAGGLFLDPVGKGGHSLERGQQGVQRRHGEVWPATPPRSSSVSNLSLQSKRPGTTRNRLFGCWRLATLWAHGGAVDSGPGADGHRAGAGKKSDVFARSVHSKVSRPARP